MKRAAWIRLQLPAPRYWSRARVPRQVSVVGSSDGVGSRSDPGHRDLVRGTRPRTATSRCGSQLSDQEVPGGRDGRRSRDLALFRRIPGSIPNRRPSCSAYVLPVQSHFLCVDRCYSVAPSIAEFASFRVLARLFRVFLGPHSATGTDRVAIRPRRHRPASRLRSFGPGRRQQRARSGAIMVTWLWSFST